ncbi:hypothetical protein A8C35_04875 [Ligilactobacillus salivarius]|uniref:hypothetical protein n=1 Tax=Ligilactobacillus salivarius TaxID=1624 RepID=UPI000BB062A0|nr:hypothetical protein [Ligilactobacillus salivarius]PAY35298.1 hypothetical protein A8C35_04875 [Ligilactobacillus salivarius]
MSENKKLSELVKDSAVTDSDQILVWNGTDGARRVSKKDFVGKESTKLSNMSEAVLSLRAISKTVSVDQINAKSNLTVTVDVGFETGYSSQLANLSVLVCSNPNVSVTNFWYDGPSSKLYVVVENPTTDVITNMKLFCRVPTFKNANII